MDNEYAYKPIGERVAVLETEQDTFRADLKDIKDKLDELLTLKAKGMGAFGLVSLLIGSGLIGIVFTLVQFFNRPHL